MSTHTETRKRLREISSKEEFIRLMDSRVLSDEERKILELHYIKHKPLGYIADELGFSERTVKRYHHNALMRFK